MNGSRCWGNPAGLRQMTEHRLLAAEPVNKTRDRIGMLRQNHPD